MQKLWNLLKKSKTLIEDTATKCDENKLYINKYCCHKIIQYSNNWIQILHNYVRKWMLQYAKWRRIVIQISYSVKKNPAAERKQVHVTKRWRAFYHWCISQTKHGPRPPCFWSHGISQATHGPTGPPHRLLMVPHLYKAIHYDIVFSSHFSVSLYSWSYLTATLGEITSDSTIYKNWVDHSFSFN